MTGISLISLASGWQSLYEPYASNFGTSCTQPTSEANFFQPSYLKTNSGSTESKTRGCSFAVIEALRSDYLLANFYTAPDCRRGFLFDK